MKEDYFSLKNFFFAKKDIKRTANLKVENKILGSVIISVELFHFHYYFYSSPKELIMKTDGISPKKLE